LKKVNSNTSNNEQDEIKTKIKKGLRLDEEHLSQHGPRMSGFEYHLIRLLRRGTHQKASPIGRSGRLSN